MTQPEHTTADLTTAANGARAVKAFAREVATSTALTVPAPETGVTCRQLFVHARVVQPFGFCSSEGQLSFIGLVGCGATSLAGSQNGEPILAVFGAAGAAMFAAIWTVLNVSQARRRSRSFLTTLPLEQVVQVPNPSELLLELVRDDDRSLAGRQAVWAEAQRCLEDPTRALPGSALRKSAAQTWADAAARYERVTTEWEDLLLDPLAALEHSVLLDVTKPRTAAFIAAYGKAKDAHDRHANRSANSAPGLTAVDEFADLARGAETTWDAAKQWAAHVGYDWLPEAERADAILADKLLRLAADEATAPAERVSAAERATAVLRRIHTIVLPEPALELLARHSRGELSASQDTVTGDPILAPTPALAETR